MQINVDKKSGIFIGVIVLLIAALGVSLSQKSDDLELGSMGGHDMGTMTEDSNSSGFAMTPSEIMFAQSMIPHHEQAVKMSSIALTNSIDQNIISLATEIKAAQLPEIAQMKSWLDQVGEGYGMNHEMGMDGMLTDSEISTLKNAKGAKFDKLFIQAMIAHHEGAIKMAKMIESSENSEIKALHDAIVTSQTAEIAKMKVMLTD